eukprot:362836-Chlamydomonas_euryale.AAC.5
MHRSPLLSCPSSTHPGFLTCMNKSRKPGPVAFSFSPPPPSLIVVLPPQPCQTNPRMRLGPQANPPGVPHTLGQCLPVPHTGTLSVFQSP